MRDFKELKVWGKAHTLTLLLYRITNAFPPDERSGLASQLRRSAASIPSNIAEGCGRGGERELAGFMSIAAGSASEAEYQLLLACDLGYIQDETYQELNQQVNEIKKMLNSFIKLLTANTYQLITPLSRFLSTAQQTWSDHIFYGANSSCSNKIVLV